MATVTLVVKASAVFPNASRAVTSTGGVIVAPAVAVLGCTLNASWLTGPAMTLKNALETSGKPGLAADSLYRPPLLSMLRLEKVATPATAANVRVPDKGPPAGLNASAMVTLPAKPVAVLPRASNAVTRTAGLMVAPVVVVLGCTVTASWVAVPGAMVKPALVLLARPGAVAASLYPSPALSMLRVEKAATPATAATVRVPE